MFMASLYVGSTIKGFTPATVEGHGPVAGARRTQGTP